MEKLAFDTGWEFTDQPLRYAARDANMWQPVDLPHDVSITKPRSKDAPTQPGGGYAWSGVVTYRKKFSAPAEWQGRSVQLEFEGVYMNAEVMLNRELVTLHPYGYTSFIVNLTPYLKYGEENTLQVVVNNSAQPNSRWYSGTGIYRHVWMRVSESSAYIRPWGVFVTTPTADPSGAVVKAAVEVQNNGKAGSAVLRSTVRDAAGATVAQAELPFSLAEAAATVEQEIAVQNPRLWSVDDPYLYNLTSELLVEGKLADVETTTFGIRSFTVDAENGFRLNGVPMKLKGGCVHHDNGLLGAASFDRAEERKIELMKASGYNAIRCAHNPPAPAMLDACDRLGMLVIDESFDCWRMGKNANDYHLYFEDWWQRDTESMVKRDRNHPSIIMWSIGNEVQERTGISNGYYWCQQQADFIRSLDDTRLVTSALPFLFEEMMANPPQNDENKPPEGGALNAVFDWLSTPHPDPKQDRWGLVTKEFNEHLDVVGYNYLVKRYGVDGQRFPGRVMAGTETFPHLAYDYWTETERLPYVIGDFVWTSIDYLGESGIGKVTLEKAGAFWMQDPWPYHIANCGDIDICGFKRPQSHFRDLLWGVRSAPFIGVLPPELHGKELVFNEWGWEPVIDSWTFPGQEGQPVQVDVYSKDEEVELLVNGVSAGRRKPSKNKATFEVTYQPGAIEAVGYAGGKETGRTSLKTASTPAALRLTPDRASLNAARGDLAYVTVEVVDAEGQVVKHAGPEVVFTVNGPARLLAVGAANPTSEELYVGDRRRAFEGRLMAVVQTTGEAGEITLTAQSGGLSDGEVLLSAS